MIFNFFLSPNGTLKNIHLNLVDEERNIECNFKTNLRISAENWDIKKQRPTNIYLKNHKIIYKKLSRLKLEITEHINEDRKARKISHRHILARKIKKICNSQDSDHPDNTLLYYMSQYIECKKEQICHSTYKRYKVFYHLLERFEGFSHKRLYVEEIDYDFIKNFIVFGKEEEYSENTVYRTIHFVKTILNFVERKGLRTRVRELEIKREKRHKEIVTLTEKDIVKIRSTEVPEELRSAKDWLLISCYTGQRFSDFICFSNSQLVKVNEKTCICFTQQKTGKEMLLPLHPIVLHILEENNNSFPKIITMHNYNENIKRIGKLAGLDDSLKAKKRIGHRIKRLLLPKWACITSHIGRRSFATNFYGRIPTPLLMEATGHSTEQMFLKYISSANEDRVIDLGNHFNRMYEERL